MQNLSKKILTATIVLITSIAVLLGVSAPSVKANEFLSDKPSDYGFVDISVYNTKFKVDELFKMIYDDGFVYMVPKEEQYFEDYSFNMDNVIPNNSQMYPTSISITNISNNQFQFYQNKDHDPTEPIITDSLNINISLFAVSETGTNPVTRTRRVRINDNENYFHEDREYIETIAGPGVSHRNYFRVQIDVQSLTSVPAISGEHTVINNIDSPYTLDRIREIAKLKATDAYYGDLTDDIEVIRDEYTANKTKVGTYEIEYQVTNASGLSTNFILLVANKDLTKPVISGPGTSTMSYTEEFVLSNLIARFTVTDNYDTNVKLELESTTHVPGVPGIYVFKFFAKDSSNNIATFNHTLTIVDDVKPTITDTNEGVIQVNWRDQVTNEILLMHLTAHDAIDGDLTESIQVIENNIKSTVGNYTVKYQVTDSAGNSGLYTRTYKVVTTDAPVFWVSANLLLISEVNALTNQQLADELASYEGINMASHMMLLNEYEGNENVPGTYMVRLAINDTRGEEHIVERTIEVFADDELPELELSIWKKIGNFFVSVWEFIVKVFTWIWNAIKWVFNFVFGWIN